jgi:hypothetical protein
MPVSFISISSSGGSTTMEKRHNYVSSISYCGKAAGGSLEAASVWTITRIEVHSNGSTTITIATDVAWTDRLTTTYS